MMILCALSFLAGMAAMFCWTTWRMKGHFAERRALKAKNEELVKKVDWLTVQQAQVDWANGYWFRKWNELQGTDEAAS